MPLSAELRDDPAFKLALERDPETGATLCSQPTISRMENLADTRALIGMAHEMVRFYCASFAHAPRQIVLEIDDAFDTVYGHQQLRLFNAYYDEYGFQPIVVFDGDGRLVGAVLRPACRPTGKEAAAHIRRLIRAIRRHWPTTAILLRAETWRLPRQTAMRARGRSCAGSNLSPTRPARGRRRAA